MIRIEMLPAQYGDCLLVEYGSGSELHRILVDGGLAATFQGPLRARLASVGRPCPLELLVVTHVDEDHILGILTMLQDAAETVAPRDVWFNGYKQISDLLGPQQGDDLSDRLKALKLPWNAAFERKAVVTPKDGTVPAIDLPGGARLVLLSPGPQQLEALVPYWDDAVAKAKLRRDKPAPTKPAAGDDELGKRRALPRIDPSDVPRLARDRVKPDDAPANGSSIAFVLEHGGAKVLLAGDAHPTVLAEGLYRYGGGAPVALDAVKLPHHASRRNVTAELLEAFSTPRFLVSTNGDKFGHPDPEAIARIAMRTGPKKIYFNYESDYTRPWATSALADRYALSVAFGEAGRSVVEVGRASEARASTGRGRARGVGAKGSGGRDLLGGPREGRGATRSILPSATRPILRSMPRPIAGVGLTITRPRVPEPEAGGQPGGRGGLDAGMGVAAAPPTARAEPAAHRIPQARSRTAAAEPRRDRFVQARVFAHDGTRAEEIVKRPLRGNAEHEIQVWVGPPSGAWLQSTTVLPEGLLPPRLTSHVLTVAFVEPTLAPEPQVQQVLLPRAGESGRCLFKLHTGTKAASFEAQITVLYENRILQTLRLSGGIERKGRKAGSLTLRETIVRTDPDAAARQPPFDASVVVGNAGAGQTVTAFRDGNAVHVSTKGVDAQLRRIQAKLEEVSADPEKYGPPDDPDTQEMLGELAALGAELYTTLRDVGGMKDVLDPSVKRIQIVSMNQEDILPLEFCYTRAAPTLDAKICVHWKEALDNGCCTVPCPQPEDDNVCVLGFLGMSAVVERHRYTPEDEADLMKSGALFEVQRGPEADAARPLQPLRSLLRAVVSAAPGPDPRRFQADLEAVAEAVPVAREAKDWNEWAKQVDAVHPGLLLLIAHTEEKKSRDLLVIGDDSEIALGNIGAAHVCGTRPNGGTPPLVVLLGCRTGAQDVPFSNYASQFRRNGAAIVLGTVSNVRGRYTAETARRIVEGIGEHGGEPFGAVLTQVRRKLLRNGNPLGLCLTAFGDADWRL